MTQMTQMTHPPLTQYEFFVSFLCPSTKDQATDHRLSNR